MKLLALVLMFGFSLLVSNPNVYACTCPMNTSDPIQALREKFTSADMVFIGKPTSVSETGTDGKSRFSRRSVIFKVEKKLKGIEGNTVTLVTAYDGATCGLGRAFEMSIGESFVVFANRGGVSLCSGTHKSVYLDEQASNELNRLSSTKHKIGSQEEPN